MINVFMKKLHKNNKDNKTILLNVFLALIIKGGSLILALFTLPAYIYYFDNKLILGTWLTLVAVLTWILNFDLGIGNGLRNKLILPLVVNDIQSIKGYISSAYISLTIISGIVAIVGYFFVSLIDWNSFFGIDKTYLSQSILLKAVRIVLMGIVIQFVLKLITSILYAMQKSFVPNLLQLSSTVLLLIFIYGGLILGAENLSTSKKLILLSYANILTVNLPLLITSIVVFKTTLKDCWPRISMFQKKFAKEVIGVGIAFLWLQLVFMVINNTNEFFITWLIGSRYVVEYQIYYKLFTLGGTLVALALTPIWSAVTKAKEKKDFIWIRKLNKMLMLMGFIGVLSGFIMIPFLQPIIDFWLGNKAIEVNLLYSFIFAISGGVFLWNRIISTISNGFGELKIQLIFLTLGAMINFPLAFVLSMWLKSYIAVVVANIISLLPYCIIQPIWMQSFLKQRSREQQNNLEKKPEELSV